MYELIQVSERSYYIQSPAKIGLVRLDGQEVCLIDSGNDKDAGRKVRQLLDTNSWHLAAIYNTHSNADHIGGNRYLQGQTGCKIYAPGIDCAFTRHPVLEPSFLYGGYPCKELRHKFLMAQESDAQELMKECLPEGFAIIPLPGHYFDMVGFRTPDDVVYLADCLSSRETLDKYQIGFIYDIAAYLNTLEMVKSLQAKAFVPAHAAVSEDIAELMSQDELAVMDGGKCILQLRGVRPFLSDKYDITKHPNFQYTADADDKNAFDIEAFLSTRLKPKPNEVYDVFEVDVDTEGE